jgi:hypothetical protein
VVLWRKSESWGRPYFFALAYFGASVKPFLSCELKGVPHGNDPLAM